MNSNQGRYWNIASLFTLSFVALSVICCASSTRLRDEEDGGNAGSTDAGEEDATQRDASHDDADSSDSSPLDAHTPDAMDDIDFPDAPAEDPLEESSYLESQFARDVFVVDDIAYVADMEEGLIVADVSDASAPVAMGHVEFAEASAVFVEDGYAYVAVNRDGLRVIDVRHPESLIEVSRSPTESRTRDVVVYGQNAYLADGYEGLRILNISERSRLENVGRWVLTGEAISVDIEVVGSLAYVVGTDNLLHIVDVNDPSNPLALSTANIPSEPHQIDVQDSLAYVAVGPAGLHIIDVSDSSNPRNISSRTIPRTDGVHLVVVRDSTAYVGTGYNDGKWIVTLDISDPERVIITGAHRMTRNRDLTSIFVDDQRIYVTQRYLGLTILE